MLSSKARTAINRVTEPMGRALARTGLTANSLTVIGLVGSVGAGVLVGAGQERLGGLVTLLAGIPDLLDGAVAKARGSSGPRGAFLDSVVDRLSDVAVLLGVVWLAAGQDRPRLAVLAALVMALALVISYVKARAQSLGFSCEVGIAERPERVLLLGGFLLLGLIEIGLWVLLVLTAITVVQRVWTVWRQAGERVAE
jgi:CDP-diacylglycerol---glycerol-3-phosphate 3-phosphatidyltransferase